MQIEAYSDAAVFDNLKPDWNALVDRSQVRTPFQTNEFQHTWWTHFGTGDLCILLARSDSGKLEGIASLFVDPEGVLRWVGGEEIADYLDVIAPPEQMEPVRQAVFIWLTGPAAPLWQRAQLSNTPDWTKTLEHWQALAQEKGWTAEIKELDVCPIVPLPSSFEEYLNQIDGKQRREIRRKRRRAEGGENAVAWYSVSPEMDLDAETETFLQLMTASHPTKAQFLNSEMRAAFRAIFANMHAAGWLQLAFLTVGESPVAAYINFEFANRIWVYNSGLNPDKAAGISAGWVLLTYLIEDAIKNGHTHFDFLQGDEDYKLRFGGQPVRVCRLSIERN